MIEKDILKIIHDVLIAFRDVLLGGAGGVIAYLFDYSRSKKSGVVVTFSIGSLIINSLIGAFVANSLGSFIPLDTFGRDGIVSFCGVSSYAILSILESRFADYILNKFVGMKSDDKK